LVLIFDEVSIVFMFVVGMVLFVYLVGMYWFDNEFGEVFDVCLDVQGLFLESYEEYGCVDDFVLEFVLC